LTPTHIPEPSASLRYSVFADLHSTISVDIFADDQKTFEAISFKGVTPYKEISDTSHTFRVRQAENSGNLAAGRHYTILVMAGTNDKPFQLSTTTSLRLQPIRPRCASYMLHPTQVK